MVLPEPKEPKFKEGDLVILYWQDSNGEVFSDDTTPNVVVNVRRDVTGPYPIYTILHPSGTTRTRYEFELRSLKGEEPMNNITHDS